VQRANPTQRWPAILVILWAAACSTGFGALWVYSNTRGDLGQPTAPWPADQPLTLDDDRPTLVLFAHPKCPCTDATLSQLERLQGRYPDRFGIRVVLYEPEQADLTWRSTRLWRRAQRLSEAAVLADPAGRITAAFGAATSGQTGLFAPSGELLFWGGLTSARGHEGDSLGSDAVAEAVQSGLSRSTNAPVFGCTILGSCSSTAHTSEVTGHDAPCCTG